MVTLYDLWLPILISAAAVFGVSSVLHMLLPIHKGDYKRLPDEAELLEALRAKSLEPGHYMFPSLSSMADMRKPEVIERFQKGPVGYATIMPSGMPSMFRSLGQWFAYLLVVGIFVGYICAITLPPYNKFLPVFRVASCAAALALAASHVQDSIWKGLSWRITGKYILDGILYAVVMGAVFGWFWPEP
ncbi:MAG: hypothetical protein FJ276_04425 [Planctomycetes bacterium]|nr:hypothetical protein [Planctomycetota bacterium]